MKKLTKKFVLLIYFVSGISVTFGQQQNSVIDTIFSTNKTPLWDYVFLRNTTRDFLGTAKDLERNIVEFNYRLSDEREKRLVLQQAVEMAGLNASAAQLGVDYARQSETIAKQNTSLAELRIELKDNQIQDGQSTLRFMMKKHEEIESRGFWKTVARGAGAALGAVGTIASMGPAGIVGASIILGGTVGISELERRDIDDRDAITERQSQQQINQMIRERIELEKLNEIAQEQVILDSIAVERAIADQGKAIEELNNARELLNTFNEVDAFPEEVIIAALDIILNRYVQYSVVLAKLTEQAYRVEEVVKSDLINSFEGYTTGSTGGLLAADKILLDLNTIEFNRITQKSQRPNFSTHTLSLRNKDPVQLELLRRRGTMSFDITQFELDLAYPGTFARTIQHIDVDVIALSDVTGIKGQLTKEGLSWKKVPSDIAGGYAMDDWFSYVPSGYRAMIFDDDTETLIFPRSREASQTPGLLDIFQGKPVCGTYTLELPKYSNRFDYNTIVDVIITIHFSSYFDHLLKTVVETEICEMSRSQELVNGRVLSVSMPLLQPDEWYEFLNPSFEDTLWQQRRYLPFYIHKDYIPTNHVSPELNELSVSFLHKGEFADMKFSVTSTAMNPQFDFEDGDGIVRPNHLDGLTTNWFSNFNPLIGQSPLDDQLQNDTVFIFYADSLALSQKQTDMPDGIGEEYELWILKLEAKDNPVFSKTDNPDEFDESKLRELQDIVMRFGYRFSYDFCVFSGRVYAHMDVDNETTTARGIDGDQHHVPYLHVRNGGRLQKRVQDRLAWYEWIPSTDDGTFTLKEILHKDKYADLVPFYSFLEAKTPIEEIEVQLDLKNIGDEAILYCSPRWIKVEIKRASSSELELTFSVDLGQRVKFNNDEISLLKAQRTPTSVLGNIPFLGSRNRTETIPLLERIVPSTGTFGDIRFPTLITPPRNSTVVESDIYRFSEHPVHLIFRYLNLSGDYLGLATVDITILEYSDTQGSPRVSRLFNKPPVFRRWRNGLETNFSLRIHRDDYSEFNAMPNLIIKDLKFSDFSRF